MIKFFHIFALVLYSYTNYYREVNIIPREMAARNYEFGKFGNSFVFLTNINFVSTQAHMFRHLCQYLKVIIFLKVISTIYFLLALLNDFYGTNGVVQNHQKATTIRTTRDFIFTTFTFTMSFACTAYFWTLYVIDPVLILPPDVEALQIPLWYNHTIHTAVTFFMSIELLCTHHTFLSNMKQAFWTGFFIACYLVWMEFLHAMTGAWIYPFLKEISPWQRLGFYGCSLVLGMLGVLFLKFVNNSIIWRRSLSDG